MNLLDFDSNKQFVSDSARWLRVCSSLEFSSCCLMMVSSTSKKV